MESSKVGRLPPAAPALMLFRHCADSVGYRRGSCASGRDGVGDLELLRERFVLVVFLVLVSFSQKRRSICGRLLSHRGPSRTYYTVHDLKVSICTVGCGRNVTWCCFLKWRFTNTKILRGTVTESSSRRRFQICSTHSVMIHNQKLQGEDLSYGYNTDTRTPEVRPQLVPFSRLG